MATEAAKMGYGRWLALILVVFVALGLVYNMTVPIWEAPDEPEHFWYIRYLTKERTLPSSPLPSIQINRREESRQPPLYYLLGALATFWIDTDDIARLKSNPYVTWPGAPEEYSVAVHTEDEVFPYHNLPLAVHIVRLLSTLMGAITIVCTYYIAKELFPTEPLIPLGAAALNAFIPGYIFMHAAVNNDNLIVMLCALALLLLIRIAKGARQAKIFLLLGLLIGLGLLTKQNALYLAVFTFLVLAALTLPRGRFGDFWRWCGITFGVALTLSSWWYVRNALFYRDAFHGNVPPVDVEKVMGNLLLQDRVAAFSWSLFESFWGVFGWQNVFVHPVVYVALGVLSVVATIGFLLFLARERGESHINAAARLGLITLFGWWVFVLGMTMVRDLLTYSAYGEGIEHGRYLYPAIPAFAILFQLGLRELFRSKGRVLIGSIGFALFLLSAVSPFLYILPAYPPPLPIMSRLDFQAIEHNHRVKFANQIALHGYSLDRRQVQPGQMIKLTLYWEALADINKDYMIFIHLLNRKQEKAGGVDGPPASNRYPTNVWRKGDFIRDVREITIPLDTLPGQYWFVLGCYTFPDLTRLRTVSGSDYPDRAVLGWIKVPLPAEIASPNYKTEANFDNKITLLGYYLGRKAFRAGEMLSLTLYWQARTTITDNYTVFVHLLDERERVVAQVDAEPREGLYPTSIWEKGEIINDEYSLFIDPATPPGKYTLEIGLYLYPTLQRLSIRDDQGNHRGDRLLGEDISITR
ncbi:MAG: glycosyltransferase family 39 protein [Chloroflexi bacterium]|nr:glycosyltransferase family 39 protein [Chloroflexota bacterium]MCL5075460.1 glycosyltransferase family 39 protein [Chloroflexota bacterium]